MAGGQLWARMHQGPRLKLNALTRADVPSAPGVYALYRQGGARYVGKASSLRSRFWGNHMSRSHDMTNSALRRNVAEHIGIASSADIKAGRHQPDEEELARVDGWIRQCEVAWL